MPLQTKTQAQALTDITTQYAANMTIATGEVFSPDLPSGDPALALFKSWILAIFDFLQAIAVQIYLYARAATCNGVDLDSWVGDYGVIRESATFAQGYVQFNAGTVKSSNILVKPGVVIQTLNTVVQYQVIPDTNNTAWSVSQNAYILPAGSLTINPTVQALTAGSSNNVQAAQLAQLASSVPGIAFVTNTAPIQNGKDQETDPELRARFKLEIAAPRATGSLIAVQAAVASVQPGLNISLVENTVLNGNPIDLLVVVDDGSGATPSGTWNNISAAVEPIRGAGIKIVIVAATALLASVAMNIRIGPNGVTGNVELNVLNALLDYINSLPIGAELYWGELYAIAFNADPNVIGVEPGSVLLQGVQADLTCSITQVIRSNNTLVALGTY